MCQNIASSQLVECRGIQATNEEINAEMEANTDCTRGTNQESSEQSEESDEIRCIQGDMAVD